MRFTNKMNLNPALFASLTEQRYFNDSDTSVTSLISPPRIIQLQDRHNDEIVEDASDRIWSLLGTIGHSIIEQRHVPDGITEERLRVDINGWEIGAKPDLYEGDETLSDYKFTSVWSYVFGVKPEHEKQLNMYAFFYRDAGFTVSKLQVVMIFRDWSRMKALSGGNYPSHQIKIVPIPVWEPEVAKAFLVTRVSLHQLAVGMQDDELPECAPEERWAKPTKYALMKEGRKSAVRVFDKKDHARKALSLVTKPKLHYIAERPGEDTRCEHYCSVAPFCNQFIELKEG